VVVGRVVVRWATPGCQKQPKITRVQIFWFQAPQWLWILGSTRIKLVNRDAHDTVPVIPAFC
jgi:hypothetical protein